ncbi:hypothetical protein DAI22_11g101050 [Oryza sativa Japonica Group]|nr:hypothetical protein DAI22_11g101050 [Oryza sativa Japonica Group]
MQSSYHTCAKMRLTTLTKPSLFLMAASTQTPNMQSRQ